MPPLPAKAIAACALATCASALQRTFGSSLPSRECEHCKHESMFLVDSAWKIPSDLEHVHAAAEEGGMPRGDTDALLEGIHQAAGEAKGAFILTVTDGGMVDMAQNMLR